MSLPNFVCVLQDDILGLSVFRNSWKHFYFIGYKVKFWLMLYLCRPGGCIIYLLYVFDVYNAYTFAYFVLRCLRVYCWKIAIQVSLELFSNVCSQFLPYSGQCTHLASKTGLPWNGSMNPSSSWFIYKIRSTVKPGRVPWIETGNSTNQNILGTWHVQYYFPFQRSNECLDHFCNVGLSIAKHQIALIVPLVVLWLLFLPRLAQRINFDRYRSFAIFCIVSKVHYRLYEDEFTQKRAWPWGREFLARPSVWMHKCAIPMIFCT